MRSWWWVEVPPEICKSSFQIYINCVMMHLVGYIYWNILTMHVPINVKSPNNINKWQMGFNSAFKGLNYLSWNFTQVTWYACLHVQILNAYKGRCCLSLYLKLLILVTNTILLSGIL
jgi:hypothetical protein